MRKELKSKSRRKWLIGGSLAFASVALLTTGFATWVIGVTKTSGDGQVNIGVDTAKDNSVELTFNLEDDQISVAENAGTLNSNLTIERDGSEGDIEPDWNIKIKDLNIAVGQTFYDSLKKSKQDLKIVFALQKDVTEDKNSVTDDKVKVRGGQAGSSWKYIDLVKSKFDVTLPESYPTDGKIYDISDKSHNPDEKIFSFIWGSYFDGKAPSEFYKGKEENRVVGQSLREYYQKALQELQAMNKALNKGTLKLTATFDYGQQKVGE